MHYNEQSLHEYLTRLFSTEGLIDKPNQLHPRYVGGGGNMNPWAGNDSSSRSQMLGSHLAQTLVIDQPSVRRTMTGIENQYGEYTFKITMPETGQIVKIADKCVSNGMNPQRLAVIQYQQPDAEGRQVYGLLEINRVSSRHQYFGFTYEKTPEMRRVIQNASIPKGTVFAQSPALDKDGNYRMGVSSNIAYTSMHGTIEDGVVVRRRWLERFTATGIESRSAKWGNGVVPLNIAGDETEYRTHADIGDTIGPLGIVMGTRELERYLAVVNMSNAALAEPDLHFDNLVYGVAGAEVIDVTVLHCYNGDNNNKSGRKTPESICAKDRKYYQSLKSQQRELLDWYNTTYKNLGKNMVLTPELQRRLQWAIGFTGNLGDGRHRGVKLTNRGAPVGDFWVEIQYRYPIRPSNGSKVTNLHGGKGVVVEIREDEDMPQWDDGTIADLVMDGDSVNKRMNMGSLYEVATNAVGVQVRAVVTKLYLEGKREEAYTYLMEFYQIVSPLFYDAVVAIHATYPTLDGKDMRMHHVECVIDDGIYLIIPPHTPGIGSECIQRLHEKYGIVHKPARIPTESGYVYTKDDMLIGETYIIMLEKNGFDWSAVSSATRNHYGIISKRSQADKYSRPGHDNAIRITAEAEIRLFLVLLPDHIVADILDRANNPHAHKAEVESILYAKDPAQIDLSVDRDQIPLGGNRAINYIRHIMRCAGIELTSLGRKS